MIMGVMRGKIKSYVEGREVAGDRMVAGTSADVQTTVPYPAGQDPSPQVIVPILF